MHLAQKYRDSVKFVTVDTNKFGYHARSLNLMEDKFPAFVLEHTASGETNILQQGETVTASSIQKLLEANVKENKIKDKVLHEELWFLYSISYKYEHFSELSMMFASCLRTYDYVPALYVPAL